MDGVLGRRWTAQAVRPTDMARPAQRGARRQQHSRVDHPGMEALMEFFEMGGHAAFIWPSYAIVFTVLIVLLVASYRSLKAAERSLEALEQQDGKDKT